jgi:parallel beta-helix repeat protein
MRVRTGTWVRWAAALLLVPGAVVGSVGTQPSWADSCIASGDTAGITAALSGQGAAAVLCPGATYDLTAPITFTAPDQQIYTEGLPTDSTRATLVVDSASTGKLGSTAIVGTNESGITVENIQVNGNRPALGQLSGGEALIEIGGNASGQTVQNVNAYETRGWSTLHIFEGTVTNNVPTCQNAQILNNTISDAGLGITDKWADGISLACGNSEVEDNTVTNATDGGIVIFGAPGSTISGNTVTAVSQQELGGINMVDFNPVNGNYTGTTVTDNVVDGEGAFIKVGIAIGPQIWGCGFLTDTNHGGTVTGNTVEGENVGYGYAVGGVSGWTVTGNTDTARHVGVVATGTGCGSTTPSAPGAFQVGSVTSSTLQSQFVTGQQLEHVLDVSEPSILLVPQPSTACGVLAANQGLYPRQGLASCDGRFALNLQGDGNLVLREGATALWSSATAGQPSAELLMQADGNLVLYSVTGTPLWSTATSGNPGARLVVQNDGNLVVYSPSPGNTPLWSSGTCCH